jgi:N-acetylglucosamine-6-phosphate deacetylase
MKLAFTNARIFDGATFVTNKVLLTTKDKIIGWSDLDTVGEDFEIIDLEGLMLVPGFIDIQIYGGNGKLFNNETSADTIAATYESQRKTGTTGFLMTLSTSPFEEIMKAIEEADYCINNHYPGFLGLHLEGPFFNPVKKGAHVAAYIRKPTLEELKQIVEKGAKSVKYMTIAPEMFDEETLDYLLQSHIVVSAGHSNATYQEAMQAFGRGIGRVTHLFNAMSPLQSREPGLVGATYDSSVLASIIADGIHCDFASLRISKKIMGERLLLITDAVTESLTGDYKFRFAQDRYVDEQGILSGSALTMNQAIKNCVEKVGIPLEEALRMASLYPARALQAESFLGAIKVGYQADMAILDDSLNVKGVVKNGEWEMF